MGRSESCIFVPLFGIPVVGFENRCKSRGLLV